MFKRGEFINLNPLVPTKDKKSRASAFQGMMKAGAVYFDHEADWFPVVYQEMTRFPKGKNDDIVDSLGYIGLTLEDIAPAVSQDEFEDSFYNQEPIYPGRSQLTGY